MVTLTESEIVFADRMQRYISLGMTVAMAEQLADRNDVDWHYVKERLIDRGCSVESAFDIVS